MIKNILTTLALCLLFTACSSNDPSSVEGKTSEGSNLPGSIEMTPPSDLTQ